MQYRTRSPLNRKLDHFWSLLKGIVFSSYTESLPLSRDTFEKKICQIVLANYYAPLLDFLATTELERTNCTLNFTKEKVSQKVSRKPTLDIPKSVLLKNLLTYIATFAYVFMMAFKKRSKSPSTKIAVMEDLSLQSMIPTSDFDEKFSRFVNEGPLAYLRTANLILTSGNIVGSHTKNTDRIRYGSENIYIDLLRNCDLGVGARFKVILTFVCQTYRFVLTSLRLPIFSYSFRDFALYPFIKYLNEKKAIDSITITNSNYFNQAFWYSDIPNKSFKTHMVWYSEGIEWHRLKNEDYYPVPEIFFLADEHWVWNEHQANVLKHSLPNAIFHICGPLLWYLASPKLPSPDEYLITVFDISPAPKKLYEKIFGHYVPHHSSSEIICQFIKEVIGVLEEIETEYQIKITKILKYKRKLMPPNRHTQEYVDLINELREKNRIVSATNEADMYNLIAKSNATISFPFTSPAHIGEFLGVPSFYYDCTGGIDMVRTDELRFVQFIDERLKLKQSLVSALKL